MEMIRLSPWNILMSHGNETETNQKPKHNCSLFIVCWLYYLPWVALSFALSVLFH